MNCLILMTTYNGEKYIEEQIKSIINQTFSEWKLIIRDDGSTDSTASIIENYCRKDDRIKLLINTSDRHGAYLNFFSLINYAHSIEDFDYYFFSDQDDIWCSNKIERMIKEANKLNNDVPRLLYSDMQIIDSQSNTIFDSLNGIMGIGKISGMSLFFTHGFLWGCDSMINKSLFKLVPIFPLNHEHIEIMSHDNYYGKFALLFGEICYIDEVYVKHRRHEKNETGSYYIKLNPFKILKKIFFEFDTLSKVHARVYNQSLLTVQIMKQNNFESPFIDKIASSINRGGLTGCVNMIHFGVKRKQLSRTIGIYLVFLFKTYKKYIYKDIE